MSTEVPSALTLDVFLSATGTLDADRSGHANEISTTKYTLVTWLPMSFMMQFRRIANVYFFIIFFVYDYWHVLSMDICEPSGALINDSHVGHSYAHNIIERGR